MEKLFKWSLLMPEISLAGITLSYAAGSIKNAFFINACNLYIYFLLFAYPY